MAAGQPGAPFAEVEIAPAALELAVEALLRLGAARAGGIGQRSAVDGLSYLAIARRLAERWGYDPALVRSTTTAAIGWQGEPFLGVKLVDPAWTRARWEQAQAALAQWQQQWRALARKAALRGLLLGGLIQLLG